MALAGQNKGYATTEPDSDKSVCFQCIVLSQRESMQMLTFF